MTLGLVDVATLGARVITEVEQTIVGKRPLLTQILAAVLAGGHVLLEDYPGLAKTLLIATVAQVLSPPMPGGAPYTAITTPALAIAPISSSAAPQTRSQNPLLSKSPHASATP